jgi:hypothetical protein
LSWTFLIVSISIPRLATGQAVPYARTFTKSKEEIDKALKEMQAYAGQKLPVVDGFVATGDQPLNRFERAFYQFSIDLLPASSRGTDVRVIAKITAWYADPDPWKSGYQVLPSNGRLELDLLDRVREKLEGKTAASTARSDVQTPRPKLDLATGLPGSLPSARSSVVARSATTSDEPGNDEVASLRIKREAEEKRAQQLNAELQSLQEIQRNQARPLNLVVVKNNGTPVLVRPAAGSHPLFTAAANDEFEFLNAQGEWIHVQISGVSRGYIRRSSLDLPDFIAARLQSPNGAAATDEAAATERSEVFRIEREEISTFPGDWETLRGKPVKIYTVQPTSRDSKETKASAKLSFCASIFQKFSADAAAPAVEGIVVIFDSADGGIVAATRASVQQMASGSLSRDNFWKQCYLEPPDAFQPLPKP